MNDDKSKVDELSESLYSRTRYHGVDDKRSALHETDTPPVNEEWNSPSIDDMIKKERRKTEQHSTLKKVFFVAVLFFICAAGVAGYIFFNGGNYVSSKNVDISVLGPTSVNAGETIELGVTVENKNNADLEDAVIYIQYPEGTRDPQDSTLPLTRGRQVLGEIKAGRNATYTLRSIMFGEKGETKQLKITIEYKVAGSNATFSKEKDYDIGIGNTPVSLNAELPPSVTSGDTFTTTLTILANSSEILKNVIIRAEYPYGYTLVSSSPTAQTNNKNVWAIGDLSPGDKKTITINGRLTGQDDEERTFRFYAGIASNEDINVFETPLSFITQTVPIKRPNIGLSVQINNGNSDAAVAPAGQTISSSIEYRNNMPTNLENVRITARLSGTALDRNTIQPIGNGFYDSNTNTIVWDYNSSNALRTLVPGDRGFLNLNFASLAQAPAGSKNQQITLDVTITGTPTGSLTPLSVTESKIIKIASEVNLSARSLYSRGPFKNTGPIPPHAEEATTYTLVFDLRNTQNNINDAKVTAQLGPNVKWLQKVSPQTENVTYDEVKRTLAWNLGTLASGSGFDAVGREVSVQVSLTPSIGQVNTSPILATNISFSGTDSFTGVAITNTAEAITTNTTSDPAFIQGNGTVTK